MTFLAALLIAASLTSTALAQAAGEATVDRPALADLNFSDPCADGPLESYSLGYHIAGIFIVIVVSGSGIFGALCLCSAPASSLANEVVQVVKMFGIGVIAATAWIHLLPDAFSQFSNPCLQGYWNVYGTAYVGLFGMSAAFMVQLVEVAIGAHEHPEHAPPIDLEIGEHAAAIVEYAAADPPRPESAPPSPNPPAAADAAGDGDGGGKLGGMARRLQTVVLEGGILTHSVIIGIALGVTPDGRFTSLLIAVCFHQVCERDCMYV